MSGTIEVEADPDFPGGHALLRVRGAGKFGGPAGFWIKRDDYDEGVFGPRGWQVADALLTPDGHSVEGDDLLLHVGPAVVQHLENAVYRIGVPAVGVETTVFWPDLPLLADEALNIVGEPPPAATQEVTAPPPKILRPGPETQPKRPEPSISVTTPWRDETPAATKPGPDDTVLIKSQPPGPEHPVQSADPEPARNWLPIAGLLLAVLAVAAGGGYFGYRWLFPPAPEVAQQTPPAAPATPEPEPSPAGPDLRQMSAAEALRSGASPEALVAEAERRMQLDGPQRSEALLLLHGAADRNYAPAHAALGRLYDPGIPHPLEVQPDARQAAANYRLAVNGGDTSVADARAALQAYLQQQASHGNMFAPLILKEFWP
jgi:hypothetical protein